MTRGKWFAVLSTCALAACGQAPMKPAANHITAEEARADGAIPEPVQITPLLPKPKPAARPETYTVVVNNVRANELLFALARDARLQIDIDPHLSGNVTLNAIDQTLPQLLNRIARQIDMRYELDGDTLIVMRDAPFLRSYKIDYLSASRNVKMQSTSNTQFGAGTSGTAGSAGSAGPTSTGATSVIDIVAQNNLWESIVLNVKEILRETDKVIPAATTAVAAPAAAPAAGSLPGAQPPIPAPSAAAQPGSTFQEAASVIANRESGLLYVRATAKQHERVQEFLDQVMSGAKRQVLIEATVTEVQLRNEYQRGIEWQRLRNPGLSAGQPALPPATSATPGFVPGASLPFVTFISTGGSFTASLKLLEQFGDVKVLSSPKLSVLNNQTAILRVTRDIIYFTVTPSTSSVTVSGGGTAALPATFTTTPHVAAEGFMMAVLPQINQTDAVVLNVRPTIRRRVDSVRDPNPALQATATTPAIPNEIPVFETREFDSILRLQSGQIGVLAGLMQDIVENTDSGIPGLRSIPILGELFSNRSQLSRKTELVIFLRATVVRDPSVDGDFASLRNKLPTENFLANPNPGKFEPPLGPGDRPLR